MDHSEILEKLDESRERLLVALEPLPEDALHEPMAANGWSIADVLAHLATWEAELVTALLRIDQGREPAKMLAAFADVDGYNARSFAENKDRDLESIFNDLQGVRRQLEQWLEAFSEKDLANPRRYSWANGVPLWKIIEDDSFGHEEEHLPEIEAFAARWLDRHAPQP